MARMKIRDASARDGAIIADISRIARTRAMPWLPVKHSQDETVAFYSKQVLPFETVLICEHRGAVAGFAAFADDWLNHLYVRPDFWDSGTGSALLTDVQSRLDHIQLWTFQKNEAARRFYRRHGFDEAEFTDGSRNEEHEPDVRMIWQRS